MAYTTIDDPSAYFQSKAYTGNGSDNSITNDGNSNLQSDLIWIKRRDYNNAHVLLDSTRGVTKFVSSDDSAAETTLADRLTSFDSNGFTVESTSGAFNADGEPFIAWQWKANGGTRSTFTESGANPGGGYQVNTTAGFSIVDYTGTGSAGTISHGLTVAPEVIIVKNRGATEDWCIYHHKNTAAPETDFLELNEVSATADATVWNDTAPTTSVFSVGTQATVNSDGVTYIAYCWAAKQGYSKFGSYEGNGDANGPFVYTGFKPAFIMLKNAESSSSTAWRIWDTKRNPGNLADIWVDANDPDQESESATVNMDILSTGFKPKVNQVSINSSGEEHVYIAFAEQPLVTSGGVPAIAR